MESLPEFLLDWFPDLSTKQHDQLLGLKGLYLDWNQKVNVISRKDMDHFFTHHVVHSLTIAFYYKLNEKRVLDVGTGGGFPGVPLAILFPNSHFTLVDSVAKKLKVADDVCGQLGVENVRTVHHRMEELEANYDYITGRAVKNFPLLLSWIKHLTTWKKGESGLLYLKGGDFTGELDGLSYKYNIHELRELSGLQHMEHFETKQLVYLHK